MNDSLITTAYSKTILSKFKKAVKDYGLIRDGDKICVCVSGGKDSMLLAVLMKYYQKYGNVDFSLEFLCLNPGYRESDIQKIYENSEKLKIPIEMINTKIFDNAYDNKNPCFTCARIRRKKLYEYAKSKGMNKIALGHHYDDVITTTLMGMLYGGQMQTMRPMRQSDYFEGVSLIRPLYLVRESDIVSWAKDNNLNFISCGCAFSEESAKPSKRAEVKHLIKELAKTNPQVEANIFRSAENVNVKNLISYKDENGKIIHNS